MIYLEHANVLFLKPLKVAGTSFEIALSKYAQPADIITPLEHLEDEMKRINLGFHSAQNYKMQLTDLTLRDVAKTIYRRTLPRKYYNHMIASDVRSKIGERKFREAYKISIVRNPYDMLVSMYFWDTKNRGDNISFVNWIRENPEFLYRNNRYYFIDGELIINKFIRFEKFESDLRDLEIAIPTLSGISKLMNKIRTKDNVKPKRVKYDKIYANEAHLINAIEFYNKDIMEMFQYSLVDLVNEN